MRKPMKIKQVKVKVGDILNCPGNPGDQIVKFKVVATDDNSVFVHVHREGGMDKYDTLPKSVLTLKRSRLRFEKRPGSGIWLASA